MKTFKTIIICLLIYATSCFGMYKYTQTVYSPGGVWENIESDYIDVIMTFCPLVNTLSCIALYTTNYPKKDTKSYNKFFKIKK